VITLSDRDSFDNEKIADWVVMNQRDCYGNTALHLAAWSGSKKIFKYLVKNGADKVGN
jgi:ankyrin repeat protein